MKKMCLILVCLSILVFAPKQQVAFAQYEADFEIFGLTCTPANPVVGQEVVLTFAATNNFWIDIDSLMEIDTDIDFMVNGPVIENFLCATFCPNRYCAYNEDNCRQHDWKCLVPEYHPGWPHFYEMGVKCDKVRAAPPAHCFCVYDIYFIVPWIPTDPGEYTVAFRIDPGNNFSEENEGDNYVEMNIIVSEAAIPTLTEWGLIIFGVVLLGFITWVFLRRRKAISLGV